MKDKLIRIMLAVALPLIFCIVLPEVVELAHPVPFAAAALVLLVVELALFVVFTQKFGGIPCPNCGYRVNPKYAQKRVFDGRFACPKCGTVIEK